jgi:hypothetical protein
MSEYIITTCDICAPNGLKPATAAGGDPPKKGYVIAPSDHAIAKLGWEEQEVGHVCPFCIQIQKDRAARDAAEEAVTENGIAISLEEGLAELDAEEAKLFTPEAEVKIRDAIKKANLDALEPLTYEKWATDTRELYAAKRTSLRKSFGQVPPI